MSVFSRAKTIFSNWSLDWSVFTELPTLKIRESIFIDSYKTELYKRILFTTLNYIQMKEKQSNTVIPTCMDRYSPYDKGLINYVASTMAEKTRVILKKEKLSDDSYTFSIYNGKYESGDESLIELDFRNFDQSDLIAAPILMLYSALSTANRGLKLSQALLVKIAGLSDKLSTKENQEAIQAQIGDAVKGIKDGQAGFVDGGSDVKLMGFDVEPTEKTKDFVYNQLSNITGFPMSFFNGAGGSSLSDTGESDEKQTRKAVTYYFYAILNPILETVFKGEKFELKPLIDWDLFGSIISTIEMANDINDDGKKYLYKQAGIKDEFITISNEKPNTDINGVSDGSSAGTDPTVPNSIRSAS